MKHHATPSFWRLLERLPVAVRDVAEKNFDLLKRDPRHPGLHFKKVGRYWSARIGQDHRALALEDEDGLLWVWVGSHDEYDRMVE